MVTYPLHLGPVHPMDHILIYISNSKPFSLSRCLVVKWSIATVIIFIHDFPLLWDLYEPG